MKTCGTSIATQVSHFSAVMLLILALAYGTPLRAQESKAAQTVTPAELSRLIGGPTLITLHFKNAPPEAVFAEIARQAGVTIDASSLGKDGDIRSAPVSIDVERQPFWQVYRTLASRLNVDADIYGTVINIERPDARSLERGPVSDQGLVLVVADNSALTSGLSYSTPGPRTQSRSLNLILLVDPKLRLLDTSPPLKLETVVDEAGRTVLEAGTSGEGLGGTFGISKEIICASDSHSAASRRMREVKGTARLFVGFNTERWEVPDILTAKNAVRVVKRATGPSRYTVQNVVTTDTDYELHLTVSKQEFDLQEEPDGEVNFERRVHLFDAQGNELPQDQFGTRVDASADPVSLVVTFERSPKESKTGSDTPQKLVIEIPDIRAVEVPVEFTDLPLP